MKRLALIFSMVLGCQIVFGQLKVVQNGNVGIGTNNPQQKLQVEGNTYLSGNVGIGIISQHKLHVYGGIYMDSPNNLIRILPNNPGTEIGSNTGKIDFWYSDPVGWNYIEARNLRLSSDSTLK